LISAVRPGLAKKVAEAFSPDGAVARAFPGFEPRPGQVRLAVAWAEALAGGDLLVAEAATGIGKTLAYLVPAVLSGRKTIVSTGTKTLQQQLVENDIPLVRQALGIPFSCAVLKGRANYLCRRRWNRFAAEPFFEFVRDAALYGRMAAFAEGTRTGDLSACPGVPEDFRAWSEVNARSEVCDASSCAEESRCFLMEARRRAAAADVVVVNHHLFFAALALRVKGDEGSPEERGRPPRGEMLPDADAVVFDEAHGIEEVASTLLGAGVSLGRARELCRDVLRACGGRDGLHRSAADAAEAYQRTADAFFGGLGDGDGRFALPEGQADPAAVFSACPLAEAASALSSALSRIGAGGSDGKESEALCRRVRSFVDDLAGVLAAAPPSAVAWGERRGPAVSLWGTPVDVAPLLSRWLWDRSFAALLTSATLSVSRDLRYFAERVGLGEVDAKEIIVDNEFDFAGRALVYVPAGLPDPGDGAFPAAAARETAVLLRLSGGGALVLCTSHRTLGAMKEALQGALPYTLLVQGEAPRMHLLQAFRRDGNAVLIGTGTFWEGIDVPGRALRCVVIDKLPFAPPADPVVGARIRAVHACGLDPFTAYQVPEAVLALRQGIGRLLRRNGDFGLIAILDRRIVTKPYGAAFRENLPPMPWTRDRSRVEGFFRRFGRSQATLGQVQQPAKEEDAR
jgi:ATP-dependent DNA helicase DinG